MVKLNVYQISFYKIVKERTAEAKREMNCPELMVTPPAVVVVG